MPLWRVQMVSRPGFYAQYDGHVDVHCDSHDDEDIFQAAVRKLRATAFPERGAACWRMEGASLLRSDAAGRAEFRNEREANIGLAEQEGD